MTEKRDLWGLPFINHVKLCNKKRGVGGTLANQFGGQLGLRYHPPLPKPSIKQGCALGLGIRSDDGVTDRLTHRALDCGQREMRNRVPRAEKADREKAIPEH